MGNYRVIGARKDDGTLIDEPIVADSPDDAAARANRFGVLVHRIESIDPPKPEASTSPSPLRSQSPNTWRRRRNKRQWRDMIRIIVSACALVTMLPGFLIVLFSAVFFIAAAVSAVSPDVSLNQALASRFGNTLGIVPAIVVALFSMLFGALLFVLLYIEDHLRAIADAAGTIR